MKTKEITNAMELPKEYDALKSWIQRMKFGRENILVQMIDETATNTADLEWTIPTAIIDATVILPCEEHPQGYLGAIIREKNDTKANDLNDGPYCEETWNGILGDIVGWLTANAQPA